MSTTRNCLELKLSISNLIYSLIVSLDIPLFTVPLLGVWKMNLSFNRYFYFKMYYILGH